MTCYKRMRVWLCKCDMFVCSFTQRDLVFMWYEKGWRADEGLNEKLHNEHAHTRETIGFVPCWMRWCHRFAFPCASYQVAYQHAWLLFNSAIWKNDRPKKNTHMLFSKATFKAALACSWHDNCSKIIYFRRIISYLLSLLLQSNTQAMHSSINAIYVPCEVVKHSKWVT